MAMKRICQGHSDSEKPVKHLYRLVNGWLGFEECNITSGFERSNLTLDIIWRHLKKKNTTVDVTSREFCQKCMMCTEVEKVEAIHEITEACELIKYVYLSMKGLNSLDEMKNKLREYLKGLERTLARRIGKLCNHSNTFSVQTSQIFVQSMVNYPTICNSFSSWEGSPTGWYVSSNCRELKQLIFLFRSWQRVDERTIRDTIKPNDTRTWSQVLPITYFTSFFGRPPI